MQDVNIVADEGSIDPVKYFFIHTMGCQMNAYDSDFMARTLTENGLVPVETPEEADVILVNTCTVREKPAQKAYSYLGRMTRLKKCKKGAVVLGVVGCLAQEKPDELRRRFPNLDIIAGPREVGKISFLLDRAKGGACVVATDPAGPPPAAPVDGSYFKGRITASVSIMEGCNNFCTYCIVPYVRGREISRSPEDILREAETLVDAGVRDITLLGQNVNSYRWEEKGTGKLRFPGLVREIASISGLKRVRFTTSHPKDLSEDLIGCFENLPALAPHIHLPFQAGSDRILRKMGRGYTRNHYLNLVDQLRRTDPEISITSDAMVGFPGETEGDFHMTMDLVERARFDGLFSFKYSDRDGTPAARMKGKVSEEEKSRRLNRLQSVQKEITRSINEAVVGQEMEVLVEGPGKRHGQFTGRTGSNKIVNFVAQNQEPGSLVRVRIRRGYVNSLLGELAGR